MSRREVRDTRARTRVEEKGITDMPTTEDALEVVTAQLARLQEELSLKSEEVEGLTSQAREANAVAAEAREEEDLEKTRVRWGSSGS